MRSSGGVPLLVRWVVRHQKTIGVARSRQQLGGLIRGADAPPGARPASSARLKARPRKVLRKRRFLGIAWCGGARWRTWTRSGWLCAGACSARRGRRRRRARRCGPSPASRSPSNTWPWSVHETLVGADSVFVGGGHPDRLHVRLRLARRGLLQRDEDVVGLVEPAALVEVVGVDLVEGGPEPKSAVADGQARAVPETLSLQVTQHVAPGRGGLAQSVFDGHPLPGAAGVVFYALDHWWHWCHRGVWHPFALAGSICHYSAILLSR